MATYTENYGLHQWESGDDFLREDFNEDFEKIDTAITEGLATKCEVVFGSYAGDGSASRVIELGFKPKAVILEVQHAFRGDSSLVHMYGGLIMEESPLKYSVYGRVAGTITEDGFQVYYESAAGIYTNQSGYTFHYIAFK